MADAALPMEALLRPHRPADQGHFVASFRQPHGIAFEEGRRDAFRNGEGALSQLYFWTQDPCLVTTQSLARRPGFELARERSAQRGWPVAVRRSGGGTVFHGPDVLCVSLLERLPLANANAGFAYDRFCTLLLAGLRDLGVTGTVGQCPAAPCDGRFNLLVGDRKIAGTAARISLDRSGATALLHAFLLVDGCHAGGVDAVQRFERDLGLGPAFSPDSMTGLADHIPDACAEAAAAAIRRAFSQTIGLPRQEKQQ